MTTTPPSRHVRLGTRGSPLALWQARWVADALRVHHPDITTEIVVLRTTGDTNRRAPLAQLGTKGLFVKEIEEALLRQDIDLAVHSMKDMPTTLPPGLHFGAVPRRGEVRDAFVGRDGRRLAEIDGPGISVLAVGAARRSCWPSILPSRCAISGAMWRRGCGRCARVRWMGWSWQRPA